METRSKSGVGKYVFLVLVVAVLVLMAKGGAGQESSMPFSADDFVPVVSGGPTEVAKPELVTEEKDSGMPDGVLVAATAQDAINAAVARNCGSEKISCTCIRFPSGLGFVATGTGLYRILKDETQTRLSKRQAYVSAFIEAKRNLAETLSGLSAEHLETIQDQFTRSVSEGVDDSKSGNGTEHHVKEEGTQIAETVLRGFCIYRVEDIPEDQTVHVSIVTTPRTLSRWVRASSACLSAETLTEGLEEVFREIQAGIVPPVGGRMVRVPSTGETAMVGCGSAIIERDSDRTVAARFRLAAEKIAQVRARAALCGMICANPIWWQGKLTDCQDDIVRPFAKMADPLEEGESEPGSELERERTEWVHETQYEEFYRDAQKGKLPPGVVMKSWTDREGGWTYSLAVFIPRLGDVVRDMKETMDETNLAFPDSGPMVPEGMDSWNSSGGKRGEEQGPTGQVSPDEEL